MSTVNSVFQQSQIAAALLDMRTDLETKKQGEAANLNFESLLTNTSFQTQQKTKTNQAENHFMGTEGQKENVYETYATQKKEVKADGMTKVDTQKEWSEEETNAVKDAVEEIAKELEETFHVTEEELELVLESLGMTMMDLLNVENLTTIAMDLSGAAQPAELLLNAEFTNLLSEVTEITQNLATELQLSPEEMELFLQMNTTATQESVSPEQLNAGEDVQEFVAEQEDVEVPLMEENQELVSEKTQAEIHTSAAQTVRKSDTGDTGETVKETIEVVTEDTRVGQEEESLEGQTSQQEQTEEGANEESLLSNAVNTKGNESISGTGNVTYQTVQNVVTTPDGTQVVQQTQQMIHVEDIIDQITRYTVSTISETTSSVEMQLNPANLGKMYIQVETNEGVITARIAAQNEAVKEALEVQAPALKESMNEQGLKVQDVEVVLASHEFEENLEKNHANQERDRQEQGDSFRYEEDSGEEVGDITLEQERENLTEQIMRDSGNTMNLTA